MGIGHFAVGLALKRVEPRTNAGLLIFAAFLPDFLLGLFVLGGIERYEVPANYAALHYLIFAFPFSHGMLATILWAALAYSFIRVTRRDDPNFSKRLALIVAAAVCSHFVLDAIVHVRGLPVLGEKSFKLALGLWNRLAVELSLEAAMVVVGIIVYWTSSKHCGGRRAGMVAFTLILAAVMIGGQAGSSVCPERGALVASWIAMPPLIAAIAFWLDRPAKATTA